MRVIKRGAVMKEEDYKFVYKISCEPKISSNQDFATITQKMIATRAKMVNEATIKLLKEIAEEKGYSEILIIDESKVANFVNVLKAYNLIINKEVDIWLLNNCDYDNYVRIRNQSLIDSKVYCDDGVDNINVVFEKYCAGDLSQEGWLDYSCLSFDELHDYLNGYSGARKIGKAIHITRLEVFDKPKPLSDFRKVGYETLQYQTMRTSEADKWRLTRAPQSWQYVFAENSI